jgi:hypothetical protein
MTWHTSNKSGDGMVDHVADSRQWHFIDEKWPNFANEPCNVHMGLTTNGINLFAKKCSTWSTWLVILLNYNLHPRLTTKKHFAMLSLFIPSEESMISDNMDTYLEPLLKEFKLLWHEGVKVHDVAIYNGTSHFTLRAILMWCIHDFLTYGIMASCVTKRYHACPICGP